MKKVFSRNRNSVALTVRNTFWIFLNKPIHLPRRRVPELEYSCVRWRGRGSRGCDPAWPRRSRVDLRSWCGNSNCPKPKWPPKWAWSRFRNRSFVEQKSESNWNQNLVKKAPERFELSISCLLDRRFNQLSHGANMKNYNGSNIKSSQEMFSPTFFKSGKNLSN